MDDRWFGTKGRWRALAATDSNEVRTSLAVGPNENPQAIRHNTLKENNLRRFLTQSEAV